MKDAKGEKQCLETSYETMNAMNTMNAIQESCVMDYYIKQFNLENLVCKRTITQSTGINHDHDHLCV